MKKCVIITNYDKDENLSVTKRIQKYLIQHGCECVIPEKSFDKADSRNYDLENVLEGVEAIIVIGGDGTLIQAAHDTVGTLGYLTEIGKDNINSAMDALIADNYEIEERMMLEGKLVESSLEDSEVHLALNDIVISRVGGLRVVNYDIYVNDKFLAT